MNFIRQIRFVCVLLVVTQCCLAVSSISVRAIIKKYNLVRTDYSMVISIPKCGTHLMTRVLSMMPVQDFSFNPYDWDALGILEQREKRMQWAIEHNAKMAPGYAMGIYHIPKVGPLPINLLRQMSGKNIRSFDVHWPFTEECEALFEQCTKSNFFVIRDPRDMIVSMAHMIKKGPNNLEAKISDVLLDFIDGRKKSFVPWAVAVHALYPLLYTYGVTGVYKLYVPWMKVRKFITVRFEDLVGEEGGGSRLVQMNELRRIAKHLDISLSPQALDALRDNIFGKSSTFREGKIGSWRNHFTQEMIDAYKKVPGACKLLIALGYEKDTNW